MSEEEKTFDDDFNELTGSTPEEPPEVVTPPEPPETPEPKEPVVDDPYAGLSPEAAERLKKVEEERDALAHRIESDEGRVRSYQQKYEESQAALNAKPEQPSEEQVAAAMRSPEAWGSFKEEYPEIGGSIEAYMDFRTEQIQTSVDGKIQEVDSKIAPVAETVAADTAAKNEVALEETFPKWQDHVATKDFGKWMEGQPGAVQGLAASDSIGDAAALLNLYDTHLVASGKDPIKTPVASGGKSTEADEVSAKRRQQLEDAETVPSKAAGIDPGEAGGESDFETAFSFYADKLKASKA